MNDWTAESSPGRRARLAGPSRRSLAARLWAAPAPLLTLAVFFWSCNFVVGRAVAAEVPPVALAFWRWTLGLVLVLVVGHEDVRRDWPIMRANVGRLTLLAALGIAAFNTFVYIGLATTTALNALLLQSAMPIVIIGATLVLFGERPGWLQALGVMVSICGVATIASRGNPASLAALELHAGDLWVIAAVVAYAGYSALLRQRPPIQPLSFLAATFALGSLMLAPLYAWEHVTTAQLRLTPVSLLAVGYVAIFPAFVSQLFFNRGVELAGANAAGHFVHLMPLFGSVLAVGLLGERLAGFHILGGALIAAGLVLAILGRGG